MDAGDSRRLVFVFIVREGIVQRRLWEGFSADADPERFACLYLSIRGDAGPGIRNLVEFHSSVRPQLGHVT